MFCEFGDFDSVVELLDALSGSFLNAGRSVLHHIHVFYYVGILRHRVFSMSKHRLNHLKRSTIPLLQSIRLSKTKPWLLTIIIRQRIFSWTHISISRRRIGSLFFLRHYKVFMLWVQIQILQHNIHFRRHMRFL